jgi:hypothetical protein
MQMTPRNRVELSSHRQVLETTLCSHRLNGGGGSRGELVSGGQIPDTQGKYRQNSANRVLLAELVPRCSRAMSNAERQIPFDQEQ